MSGFYKNVFIIPRLQCTGTGPFLLQLAQKLHSFLEKMSSFQTNSKCCVKLQGGLSLKRVATTWARISGGGACPEGCANVGSRLHILINVVL